MRLYNYTLCSMAVFSMAVRTANTAAFSPGAGTGVMPLEASCTLDDFWFVDNRQSNRPYA